MGQVRSFTQRVIDLRDSVKSNNKDTEDKLIQRCLIETEKLVNTSASDEKAEGHLRRARDLISALSLLSEQTGKDFSLQIANLTAKAEPLPAKLQYLNHPITRALAVRDLKVAQIEAQIRHKKQFWQGSPSVVWLMEKNGWEPDDIFDYLKVHGDSLKDEVALHLQEAVLSYAGKVEHNEHGLA